MDFVTKQIAQKLKDKGFKEKVHGYYHTEKEYLFRVHPERDMNDSDKRCSVPTISQVLKWLRGKDIMVEIPPVLCDDGTWTFSFRVQTKEFYDRSTKEDYNSYESAALACIEHVLDNLI